MTLDKFLLEGDIWNIEKEFSADVIVRHKIPSRLLYVPFSCRHYCCCNVVIVVVVWGISELELGPNFYEAKHEIFQFRFPLFDKVLNWKSQELKVVWGSSSIDWSIEWEKEDKILEFV